mgnify:CR=1 FL=1
MHQKMQIMNFSSIYALQIIFVEAVPLFQHGWYMETYQPAEFSLLYNHSFSSLVKDSCVTSVRRGWPCFWANAFNRFKNSVC